jgi:lysophospholipase L1-like esterase
LQYDPVVVVIFLGGNDVLQHVSSDETFANVEAIVAGIRAYGAGVVLVGVSGGFEVGRYKKAYERIAKEYGAWYEPNVLQGLVGFNEYMSDAVHPNDAGYAKVVERIEPRVREVLAGVWKQEFSMPAIE